MIIAKIKDLNRFAYRKELKQISDYVENTDLSRLSYGTYQLFPNVELTIGNYDAIKNPCFVGHEKVIEVHIIIDGVVKYEYADFDDQSIMVKKPYDEYNDIATYEGEARGSFIMDNTMFICALPDDVIKYDIELEQDIITKAVFRIFL